MTQAIHGHFKTAIFCLALSGLCDMFDGKITVSDDISAMPAVSNITVNDLGNIK